MDAGDILSKSFQLPPDRKEEYIKKANLILDSYSQMGYDAFTPGEIDFILGKEYLLKKSREVNFPFLAANLIDKKTGSPLFAPYLIKKVGGIKIAIFGVIMDQLSQDFYSRNPGLVIKDPILTTKSLMSKLKKKSHLVIALTHQGLPNDKKLAREVSGIDIIIGAHSRSRLQKPIEVNDTIILQTSGRGQRLGRLDLNLVDTKKPFNLVSFARKTSLDKQIEYTRKEIDRFYEKSSGNDPFDFFKNDKKIIARLNALQKNEEEIEKKLEGLRGSNFYSNTLIPLGRKVKNDFQVKKLIEDYKKEVIEIQKDKILSQAKLHKQSVDREKISTFFVGEQSCRKCHKKQSQLWKKTRHARAYQSLVKNDRHYEMECIECHTTGYKERGGFFLLSRVERFKNVQCEACHGPGSLHKEKDGNIIKKVSRSTCLKCHNKERDPDFKYEDSLGKILMKINH